MNVGNKVPVLYRRWNEDTIVTIRDGTMYLHDNTFLADKENRRVRFLLKDYIFSGIMVEPFASIVNFEILDSSDCPIYSITYDGYIYMSATSDGIYKVSIKPKHRYWVGDTFTPVFIEKTVEDEECESIEIKVPPKSR